LVFSVASTVQEEKKKKKPFWFDKFIEELRPFVEDVQKHKKEILRDRYEIGRRILKIRLSADFDQQFQCVEEFMTMLEEALGFSKPELYACMRFAEKYPDFNQFKVMVSDLSESIEPTWRMVEHELLWEKRPEKTTTEKQIEKERKLCELEEILADLSRVVFVKKDPMLKCNECKMKEECASIKPKLLLFGEKYFGD